MGDRRTGAGRVVGPVYTTAFELEPGLTVPVHTLQTIIVGSGAAGLNCAEHLHDLGHRDIAIVTDCLGAGTSANAGSDKQTYYKIGLFGDVPDSPMDFARALTAGGMMHGDLAYIEAVGSATEFFHLVKNGVPFPHDRYGAYVGYKTDHDPRQRATSAGPRTSWLMVQRSLDQVRRNQMPILDRHAVIALLTDDRAEGRRAIGCVALDLDRLQAPGFGLVVFSARNVVLATGGPGEMYRDSVYPYGQTGSLGLALEVGAVANNLAESQFGLASVDFRWNVSGAYQQAVPAYFSTNERGEDRRDFLADMMPDSRQLATNTFLKGYQWPFHAERLQDGGSSLVDMAVHNEAVAGRLVFMDFTRNPVGDPRSLDFGLLSDEAARYLRRCGATQATPLERLRHMNPASVDVYEEMGLSLREPLQVAVCAQHNNGGLRGDVWWETSVGRLFAIGEVNGTHGVRPGGSALNAGQVGGLRAAQRIAHVYTDPPPPPADFVREATPSVLAALRRLRRHVHAPPSARTSAQVREEIQARMSDHAAFIRHPERVARAVADAQVLMQEVHQAGQRIRSELDLPRAIENEHLCLTHLAFLRSIEHLIENGGGSRGAYMVLDASGDRIVATPRGEILRHRSENMALRSEVLETRCVPGDPWDVEVRAVAVRPLPDDTSWFETTWREFQSGDVFQ